LNCVCGDDQHIFFGLRNPKKTLSISANPTEKQKEVITKDEQRVTNLEFEAAVKF
jgi:hypothetical protein